MNVLLTECVQPKSPRPGLGVGYPPQSLPIRIGVPCTGLGPLLWEGQEPPSFLSSALSFASGTSHRELTLQLVKPLTIWFIASSALPGFQKLISANIPLIVQVLLEDGLKIHTGGMTRAQLPPTQLPSFTSKCIFLLNFRIPCRIPLYI